MRLYDTLKVSHGDYVFGDSPATALNISFEDVAWINYCVDFSTDVDITDGILLPGVYAVTAENIEVDADMPFEYFN